ncbi:MAG: hypothetical protein LBS02_03435, partial [Hungatella sp.]|jgi:hypothetical protein|nr:hypothetical protein [Hungatella sp.]
MNEKNNTYDLTEIMGKMTVFKEKLSKTDVSNQNGKVKCFISVGQKNKRAVVLRGIGNDKNTAFKMAQDKTLKYIKEKNINPPWLKADFVTMEKKLARSEFLQLASAIKKYYFQYGIAFDVFYNHSFLQQEVNGACLIKYMDGEETNPDPEENIAGLAGISIDLEQKKIRAELNWKNINSHLKHIRGQAGTLSDDHVKDIIIFQTKSYFFDENDFYELEDGELCCSRRKIDVNSPELVRNLLVNSSRYLASTVLDNGRFIYGYFSCYNKEIASYNSVRHALGVYALSETYLVTKDQTLIEPIRNSLAYLVETYIYTIKGYSFVVDYESNHEIKLGGLGVAVLAIVKYLEIFDEKEIYLPLLKQIGKGIRYMQDEITGRFTHVLHFPDLEVVERFRIVYYSGEAAFALMRIYSVDKNDLWLETVQKAFDYFIENDYWKNSDHWLAYCTNELTAVIPEDRYFEFGLKNTFYNLNYIMKRITTWATFLEMLMAAKTMIGHIEKQGRGYLLDGYDIEKFESALQIRAERQLNGIFFPELAMYFKSPETILWGVFIRHHIFRVRNDDVAHHLSGYCHYLTEVLLSDGLAGPEQ